MEDSYEESSEISISSTSVDDHSTDSSEEENNSSKSQENSGYENSSNEDRENSSENNSNENNSDDENNSNENNSDDEDSDDEEVSAQRLEKLTEILNNLPKELDENSRQTSFSIKSQIEELLTKQKQKLNNSSQNTDGDQSLNASTMLDYNMWYASKAFLNYEGPVAAHLDSYNYAIEELIPNIIENFSISIPSKSGYIHTVKYSCPYFQKPCFRERNGNVIKINPALCLLRKISYGSSLYVDITYECSNGQKNIYPKKHIGDIPTMVYSNLCHLTPIRNDKGALAHIHEDVLDYGGYFVVKGSASNANAGAKVVVHQIRPASNMVHIYVGKQTNKGKPKFSIYSEIKSMLPNSYVTTARCGIVAKSGLLGVSIPNIELPIPIGVVFRALGILTEKEMLEFIFSPEELLKTQSLEYKTMIQTLMKSFEQSWTCDSFNACLDYIGRQGKKYTKPELYNKNSENVNKSEEECDVYVDDDTSLYTNLDDEMDELLGRHKKSQKSSKKYEEKQKTIESIQYALSLLTTQFLPHIGTTKDAFIKKAAFLGYMAKETLFASIGIRKPVDRDHFSKKRVQTSGSLFATQFYNAFKQFNNKIIACMNKDIDSKKTINISSYITSPFIITKLMTSALTNNKWVLSGHTQGISQVLDNFNIAAFASCMRKLSIAINDDASKLEEPRHVHGSQQGIECLYKTPEGKQVGLIQGFSMGAHITTGCDPEPIIQMVDDMEEVVIMDEVKWWPDYVNNTKIFINGNPRGYTKYPHIVVDNLRNLRRNGGINYEISIHYDTHVNNIFICTEAGRAGRAVALAPQGKLKLTNEILCEIRDGLWDTPDSCAWLKLLEKGFVEILCKDEEEEMNIAMFPSELENMNEPKRKLFTHCELTPDIVMEGAGVSTSPFNDHNQAPRNIYQESMSHQSLGCASNSEFLKNGKWHTLKYPQKPIVSTRVSRELGFSDMPMGQNAMVAVTPFLGYNQEDSLVLHKQAIDRGFMCSITYISYSVTLTLTKHPCSKKYEEFAIPDESCNNMKGNTSKLKKFDNGCVYVPMGTVVENEDVLIGIIVSGQSENGIGSIYTKEKTNISVRYDQKWSGIVHSVQCILNGEGYQQVNMVIAQDRKPVVGDKFSARHGQKGIVGYIAETNELPFFKRLGYTPDLIMNPLAFPSRMTIGMLIEAILGVAMTGSALQNPDFEKPLYLDIEDCLKEKCKGCDKCKEYYTYDDWTKRSEYIKNFDPEKDYENFDGDGSPWNPLFSLERFLDAIKRMGFNEFSEEIAINPTTGKELKVPIFTAVIYYQRLKHMVVDKISARPRGANHMVTRQPTEGRRKGGGFRVGHMERDAGCYYTQIGLREGISVPLGQMNNFENVWGWNNEVLGLEKSKQINFGKTHKQVYIMTLQDGRKIEASYCHPFLTEDLKMEPNEIYSDMKLLKVGSDRLACSIEQPLVDLITEEEITRGKIWSNKFLEELHISKDKITDMESFRRKMCLARLIGLLITDGHSHKNCNHCEVFLGHQCDADIVLDDIEKITGIRQKSIYKEQSEKHKGFGNSYTITFPTKLSSQIRNMGIIKGKKTHNEAYFPDFINLDTPLPILREFLGGVFGGDGHTVCLYDKKRNNGRTMKTVSISWTRDEENIESLKNHMETLQKLLLLFNIESTIQNSKLTTFSKTNKTTRHMEIVLEIGTASLITFTEKIGFRYCLDKALKLSAGASYRRFISNVEKQRIWICNKYKELRDNYDSDKSKKKINREHILKQAINELESVEKILDKKSVPQNIAALNRIVSGRISGNIRSVMSVEDYLTEIGAIFMFNKPEGTNSPSHALLRTDTHLPVFYLKVIDVRPTERYEEMYDITVEGTESYLANGVVSHNCMLGQGNVYMTVDRLFHQSDKYKLPICKICGLTAIEKVGGLIECRLCGTSECTSVGIPYGTKLMNNEFTAMNIVPRIIVKK